MRFELSIPAFNFTFGNRITSEFCSDVKKGLMSTAATMKFGQN
jgi:hypothetical protein